LNNGSIFFHFHHTILSSFFSNIYIIHYLLLIHDPVTANQVAISAGIIRAHIFIRFPKYFDYPPNDFNIS